MRASTDNTPYGDNRILDDLDSTRSKIADAALIFISTIAVPALAASFYRMETIGWQPIMALHSAAALSVWTITAFRKRIPYRTRAGLIVILTFIIGLGGFYTFALSGGGQAFFIISVVFSAIFFNARTAVVLLVTGCVFIAGFSGLFVSQLLRPPVDMHVYNLELRSWIAAMFGLILLGGSAIATIVGVNKMLLRSVTALRDHSTQLEEAVASRTVELEVSRQRFQDFAAASSDRFWESNEHHRFTYVSDSEQNLIPLANDILGKTRWEVAGVDPAESEVWRTHIADLNARRPFREFIFSLHNPSQGSRYYSVSGKPNFDDDGTFRGYKGTSSDVSEREELNKLKQDFIATVSHELRTPLTSIKGALGLVTGGAVGPIPEEPRNLVGIAEQNSDRLINLVNDILDVEKLQSGKMAYNFEANELVETAQSALLVNRHYGDEYGVRYDLTVVPPIAMVWADRHRLDQVFANLLSNAAKFSPQDGVVEIRIEGHANNWRVSVSDKGPGIPERYRSRVFERFGQVESEEGYSKKGTGLGLSITRSIITDHGGSIDFEPNKSGGSIFYFDLPKHGEDDPAPGGVS